MDHRVRLIDALHAYLAGVALDDADAEAIADMLRADGQRLAELEAVVERLATRRPYAPNPYRDCVYCYGYAGEHEPDCLWLAARRLMGAGGGD